MPSSIARIATEARSTLRLAVPVVAAQLGQMSMGLVDTIMVGRLGKEALAGVALGNTVFFFFAVTSMGVVMAVGPMVSQAYGAGEHEPIERSVRQGFWLVAALTVPAVLILWNIGPLLIMIGQPVATVADAMGYLHAIVWGFFPFLGYMVLRGFVEGISRPFPVTVIALLGVMLNIASNYTLMFGKLGFPALGLVGTGWASSIVFWFLVVALALFCRHDRRLRRYEIFSTIGRPDADYFRELFKIGWPIGVSLGIESGLFMLTALMIGTIGTTALAAHQVALQCAAFTFMVPLGIGMAASVRVGQAVGKGNPDGARRAGFVAVVLAALFMSGAGIVFWTLPRSIIGFFLDLGDAENRVVVELAIALLGVAAVFQVFDGIQVSAAGALRGLKDTRRPMLIGFVSYWLIGLTSAYVMGFIAGWGALGLWYGLVLGLAAAAVLLTLRFGRMTGAEMSIPEEMGKPFRKV